MLNLLSMSVTIFVLSFLFWTLPFVTMCCTIVCLLWFLYIAVVFESK